MQLFQLNNVIGDSNSGKTSIVKRYTNNYFNSNIMQSTEIEKENKTLKRDKYNINLNINIIPGIERYRDIFMPEIEEADGFIFAFDMTKEESFQEMKELIEIVKLYKNNYKGIICANKCDLEKERKINIENLKKLESFNEFEYLEISAKTGEGVNDAFEMIIFNILNNNEIYKEFDVVVDKKYELKLSKFCEINKYIDF